jgi:hypothetical protein
MKCDFAVSNFANSCEFDLCRYILCHMKVRAEDGSRVTIGNSLRTCTKKCLFLVTPVEAGLYKLNAVYP